VLAVQAESGKSVRNPQCLKHFLKTRAFGVARDVNLALILHLFRLSGFAPCQFGGSGACDDADARSRKESVFTSIKEEIEMLVLSRKVGERIMIGDHIAVVINRISGNRVTVGIEAPEDVPIVRGELESVVRSFDDEQTDDDEPSASASPIPDGRGSRRLPGEFNAPLLAFRTVR
jgi:carbon storage regulator